ncbi:hypothetical protein [Roseobacter sp. SK209-2-6]|uniref:hypothetical protein n=1 Tax=Roseobacter sp. SK209-2-6 TaxID=388739 RepID=UPI0002FD51E6|nr:hypothetical protein [Roseobacter sp. SK209-2-6]
MKPSVPTAVFLLSLLAVMPPMAGAAKTVEIKAVTVFERVWHVRGSEVFPGYHQATRQNAELLPFRGPPILSAKQATRAFRAATGCRVKLDTLIRTISGSYHAVLICPSR